MKTETYSIRGLRLPLADAVAKIKADAKIPEADKAWLAGKIERSGFGGVIVDAHEHSLDGETYLNLTIKKLY